MQFGWKKEEVWGPLGIDIWFVLNCQWRSDQAHFFPLVTSARLISRSHQLKWKSYYYGAWSRAYILAMNEAVSSLGNSNGQARDMLYIVRAEIPVYRPTKWVSASQKIKETLVRRTAFLLKVLIGIFDSGIIIFFCFSLILFKAIIFLWVLSIKIIQFSPWEI